MIGNYEKILERIARSSGLEVGEIERRVEAKRAKLSGLISKEGAAQVIAAELGINFDNEKLKINELLPGMRKVNLVAKIVSLFPVREFNKNGKEGKVANIRIADDTSNVKVVLWDVHHIDLIEKGTVGEGTVVEISNAMMRDNEIHLGSFSEFKVSKEDVGEVVTKRVISNKNIVDFNISDNVSTRAFIVQAFDPRFFYVCPTCNKKAVQEGENFSCAEHGKVVPDKRALINIVLDDGTETIRAVLFHESLPLIGIKSLDNPSALITERENILGEEMFFTGNVRRNNFFDNEEFIINSVSAVEPDKLISELQ